MTGLLAFTGMTTIALRTGRNRRITSAMIRQAATVITTERAARTKRRRRLIPDGQSGDNVTVADTSGILETNGGVYLVALYYASRMRDDQ